MPEVPLLELWGWIGTLGRELPQWYHTPMKEKQEPQKMSLYVPLPLLERIRESARKHRRSFNQEVLWLVEQSLEQGGKDAQGV